MIKRIVLIKYFGIILLKKEIIVLNSIDGSSNIDNKTIKYFLFGLFKVKSKIEKFSREY